MRKKTQQLPFTRGAHTSRLEYEVVIESGVQIEPVRQVNFFW